MRPGLRAASRRTHFGCRAWLAPGAPSRAEHPVDHVINGDGAEEAAGGVTDGNSEHVVAGQTFGDITVRRLRRDDRHIFEHPTDFHVRWFTQQALHVHDAKELAGRRLERCVADEDLGSEAHDPVRVAYLGECFRDGGVRAEDDDLRRHEAARGAFFVRQKTTDGFSVLVAHDIEHLLPLNLGHLAEEVGEIVKIHLVEDAFEPLPVEALDDAHLFGLGQLFKDISEPFVIHGFGDLTTLFVGERADERSDFGRVEVAQTSGFGLHLGRLVEECRYLFEIDESIRRTSSQRVLGGQADFVDLPPAGSPVRVTEYRDIADGLCSDLAIDQLGVDQYLAGAGLEWVEVDVPTLQPSAVAVQFGDAVRVDEDTSALARRDEADDARWCVGLTVPAGAAWDRNEVFDPSDWRSTRVEQREAQHTKRVDQFAGHFFRLLGVSDRPWCLPVSSRAVADADDQESGDPTLSTLKQPPAWWHRHLEPEERQRVMAELAIKRQEHWGFRFTTMLTLSVVVAVMGLSADSAAVVIGAMLLAPLMQPVLATAACISMALFRKSLRSFGVVALATLGSIALSYVLAALFVNGDLPREVTSRTAPDIRDLVVALGAGFAGAYATVRKDASSSLPGVAVAVALVPPLGTVGIALEAGQMTFARGAMLLYTTNLAAIVLAGAVVFVVTGFVPPKRLAMMGTRSLAVGIGVAALLVAIAIPLYRASTSAVEASDRQVQGQLIVSDWLATTETTSSDITFDGDRIFVNVTSFEEPIDEQSMVQLMQAEFGNDRIVSTAWDKVERFAAATTTTERPPSEEEIRLVRVQAIVQAWLLDGGPPSGRRLDALLVEGNVVRVDVSGVGDAPSLQALGERLDAEFAETLVVELTWLERQEVAQGEPAATPDEVLSQRVGVVARSWAAGNGLVVQNLTVIEGQVVIEVTGPEQPNAAGLVQAIGELLGPDGTVQVLFTQRLDITTTTTTTTTTTIPQVPI